MHLADSPMAIQSSVPVHIQSSTIDMLNFISEGFSRYCLMILLVLGIIGLTLNTMIFTRKVFRHNSCVHYFLASTVANYFVVYFVLPSRIFSDGYNIDPGTYSLFYCKLRFYIYFTAKSLSSWFIVLACFDRKMSSSRNVHQRAFSRLTVSRRMMLGTTFVGLLFYAHVLIFYEIDSDGKCNPRSGFYRLFDDAFYLIGYSITPPVLMLIFGIWTIRNTRRLRRVVPRTRSRISTFNRRDHNLMLMLSLQIILITLTAVPHAIQKLYTTLTADVAKSALTKASDNLFIIVVRAISFFNHSCTFYILTLSGKMFRRELYKTMKKCRFKIRKQHITTISQTVNFAAAKHRLHIRSQKNIQIK